MNTYYTFKNPEMYLQITGNYKYIESGKRDRANYTHTGYMTLNEDWKTIFTCVYVYPVCT